MSTRIETLGALDVTVDYELPGADLGHDELGPGQYALVFQVSDIVAIIGTEEELERVVVQIHNALRHVQQHAGTTKETK